jgi:DNA-binding XRE family transcriptional regulator
MEAKSDFMQWLDRQLDKDPEFKRQVDEALNEARIEQDLVALREQRGLSQAQLAKRIGVSQPAVARLEAGRTKNLTLRTLARYAAAVGAQIKIEVTKQPAKPSGKVVPLRPVRARA